MKTRIISVIAALLILTGMFSCVASANSTQAANSTTSSTVSNSTLGSLLKPLLGDAASNLTSSEVGAIAKKVLGDFNLSDLLGGGSSDIVKQILGYLNSLETTTDVPSATRPQETTTEATTEAPTEAPTQPQTEAPATQPATTAQAVNHYYYYYVDSTTAATYTMPESTTAYEYIPPETIYTDLLTTTPMGTDIQDDKNSDGLGLKGIIGIIILIGSGIAVVVLCVRRKQSY